MGSHGIKDQVAIIGMGCTRFGERWDTGTDDMLIESSNEAYESAGITPADVDAYWLGTAMSGTSGMDLAGPLKLVDKPVSLVQNFCATGSEALRQACYAVAAGAYDVAMAIGVEKVKDGGYQGLSGAAKIPTDGTGRTLTAAAMYAMILPAYAKRYGVDLRLQRRGRRVGGGDRLPGRGRAQLHGQAAVCEGPRLRRRHQGGQPRPGLRLHALP